MLIARLLKVATPPTAATVAVPESVPLPGFVPIAMVTEAVLLTRLPFASWICTVIAGVIGEPEAVLDGWTPNASFEAAGVTVRTAVFVTLAYTAEIVAVVVAPTDDVVTVKVADVDPASTVTLAATTAAELSLEIVTRAPPVGAAAVSVTVPVEVAPPTTLVGERLTEESAAPGGVTVRMAVLLTLA